MLFACLFTTMVLSDSPFTKLSLLLTFLSLTIAEHDGMERGLPASVW